MKHDLDAVIELRPHEPLMSVEKLATSRSVLIADMSNGGRPGYRVRATQYTRVGTRLAVGAVCLAVAITATLLVLPGGKTGRANADPIAVLRSAATKISALPDRIPEPNQFYYINDGSYQAWLSMDGTHDGLVITDGSGTPVPGCKNGSEIDMGNSGPQSVPCTPRPAFLADAPTTSTAMATYLGFVDGGGPVNSAGKQIYELLSTRYLRPAARAALFGALTDLEGLQLVPAGTGGLSENEIGVQWPAPGGGATRLVFDSHSDDYLGVTTVGIHGEGGSSWPTYAIVNKVGATS